jgi:integrase
MEKKYQKKDKSLNSILAPDKVRIKSASTPCAQNASPCDLDNSRESIRMSMVNKVRGDLFLGLLDKCVLLLMLEHGLRISECLSMTAVNLLGNKRLIINGLKGSNDRLIENVSYYDSLVFLQYDQKPGFFFPSRFYYYRLCIKLGIKYESTLSSKVSITHAGRHLYIAGLRDLNVDGSVISNQIGHKSSRSTNFYV